MTFRIIKPYEVLNTTDGRRFEVYGGHGLWLSDGRLFGLYLDTQEIGMIRREHINWEATNETQLIASAEVDSVGA